MALEEVSFINTNGDEVYLSNIVEQMIDYYEQKLEVGETKITDFNEGSEIRNLLEAFAVGIYALLEEQNEVSKLPFIQTSFGESLDRIGTLPFINLPRIEGNEAEGMVTFTLSETLTEDYVIPAETIVMASDTGVEYATTSDCIIFANETTSDVLVECLIEGIDGNAEIGAIDTINDVGVDTDLVTVTNAENIINGTDYEDDEAYRQRLLENVREEGFGTVAYYMKLGKSVTGVHDIKLVSNTDSEHSYTRKVLVNGFTKPVADSVLLDVFTAFSDLSNIVLGHSFIVEKVVPQTVNLTFNLNVTTEISETSLLENLTAYFNGLGFDRLEYEGLNIGQSLTRDNLVACMSIFDNFVDCEIYITGASQQITTIECLPNKVLKVGNVTWNQTEV